MKPRLHQDIRRIPPLPWGDSKSMIGSPSGRRAVQSFIMTSVLSNRDTDLFSRIGWSVIVAGKVRSIFSYRSYTIADMQVLEVDARWRCKRWSNAERIGLLLQSRDFLLSCRTAVRNSNLDIRFSDSWIVIVKCQIFMLYFNLRK